MSRKKVERLFTKRQIEKLVKFTGVYSGEWSKMFNEHVESIQDALTRPGYTRVTRGRSNK